MFEAGGKFYHNGFNKTPLPNSSVYDNDFDIELFDTKQIDNFPQFKLSRFDNTYNFSARLTGGAVSTPTKTGNSVKASVSNYTVDFYELSDSSGFEFGIHIMSGPIPAQLNFTLQHKNINAFYQPPLTAVEIAEGNYRPDDIAGSYAIYGFDHSAVTPRKITHVYRPWIEDADGHREWCDLDINLTTDQMSINIPQSFRDVAVLPVFVDPTFGYTTVPATEQALSSGFTYAEMSNTYTASTGDTLDSVSIYCKAGGGTEITEIGVYDISGGQPNNLLTSGNITANTTVQWQTTADLSTAMVNGTEYAAGFWNAGTNNFSYYWDTGISGDTAYDASAAGMSDPFAQDATLDRLYGVYATYTAGGGGPVTGSGTLVSGASAVSGSGERVITSVTGSLVSNDAAMAGTGERVILGTGVLISADAAMSGGDIIPPANAGALNDEILRATGGPTVNEGLSIWFSRTSSESLNDAAHRWLLAKASTTSGANRDLWLEFLRAEGYSGTVNDMWLDYWRDQP